jgi:hypothetical protein
MNSETTSYKELGITEEKKLSRKESLTLEKTPDLEKTLAGKSPSRSFCVKEEVKHLSR